MYVTYYDPSTNAYCYDTLCRSIFVRECREIDCYVRAAFTYSLTGCVLSVTNMSTALGAGFVSYYWSYGDGTYSTSSHPPPHTYAPYSSYTLCLYVSIYNPITHAYCYDQTCISIYVGGCGGPCTICGRMAEHNNTGNNTAIALYPVSSIYPNPSFGGFTLNLSNKYLTTNNIPLEIVDVTGKVVYREIMPFFVPQKEFDVHLNTGIYYLRIVTSDNTETIKIAIVK